VNILGKNYRYICEYEYSCAEGIIGILEDFNIIEKNIPGFNVKDHLVVKSGRASVLFKVQAIIIILNI
jgi:hypothetical protein